MDCTSRVAITGMGVVTPVGQTVETFWSAVRKGESGLGPITRFESDGFAFTRAGEVTGPGFDAGEERSDLATRFMSAAARDAMNDAGLSSGACPDDSGVVLATNFGGAISGEALLAHVAGEAEASADVLEAYAFQSAADQVARYWQLSGPRCVLSLSCASGAAALCHAAALVRSGRAPVVLAGGYDALSRFAWSGLSALRTMTLDEVRPFDAERSGTIFSEGAGAMVVERLDHALARGASIHAELVGCGQNNNAFHMTAPAREGAGSAAVMAAALRDAGLSPDVIDYINAHGTGTKHNDSTETQAIKTVFGARARDIPVTSIKGTLGHMMGAAGIVEAVASVLSLTHGVIPPTMNYRTADPECDLDTVINEERKAGVRTVLSNSAGIGGCNAAVILAALGGGS